MNPRPAVYETAALPLSYFSIYHSPLKYREKAPVEQLEIMHNHLTIWKLVSIILQITKFISSFFNKHKEELMKPTNLQQSKELKTDKMLRLRLRSSEFKLKLKNQMTNRQRIGLSVTAGHVRGGHSFH